MTHEAVGAKRARTPINDCINPEQTPDPCASRQGSPRPELDVTTQAHSANTVWKFYCSHGVDGD